MEKELIKILISMMVLSSFLSYAGAGIIQHDPYNNGQIESGFEIHLPETPDPEIEVSPLNVYLGTYSIDEPEWIEFSFTVKNVGGDTLYWFIEDFVWWIGYISINGHQGYSGTCSAGETKEFTIHVATDWLDAPNPNVNVYEGQINITSNGGDVSPQVSIGMIDPIVGEEQCPFDINFGDILFMDIRPFWIELFNLPSNEGMYNDHLMMYIGFNRFIETADYTFWDGGLFDGVQISSWSWIVSVFHNFTIGTVSNASEADKLAAIGFAIDRLGQQYQHGFTGYEPYHSWHANPDIDDPNSPYYYPDDPYIDYWYCSELIWAGYLHQGINTDATPDPIYDEELDDYFYFVHPDDMLASCEISMI